MTKVMHRDWHLMGSLGARTALGMIFGSVFTLISHPIPLTLQTIPKTVCTLWLACDKGMSIYYYCHSPTIYLSHSEHLPLYYALHNTSFYFCLILCIGMEISKLYIRIRRRYNKMKQKCGKTDVTTVNNWSCDHFIIKILWSTDKWRHIRLCSQTHVTYKSLSLSS